MFRSMWNKYASTAAPIRPKEPREDGQGMDVAFVQIPSTMYTTTIARINSSQRLPSDHGKPSPRPGRSW